jgi:diguanylate cyclase (GGDEF)-like protein
LTGLPNRFMFNELLNQAMHSARRYPREIAVMFIDLDGFKQINDTFGHEAGDKLLQELAARFRRALRSSDVGARLGGDEFVVLLQEVSEAQQLGMVAGTLLAAASEPVELLGKTCNVSASVGVAMYPRHGNDERSLMKNADQAMYDAKQRGKNNFQFWVP